MLERIWVEPHVLHISAEAITPELLRREEKILEKQELQEKRRKERLERLSNKIEDNSATSSRSSSIDDNIEESDSRTSSASTSRSATPITKNGSSIRKKNLDGKERPHKRKLGPHSQISSNEAKKPRIAFNSPITLNQSSQKNQTISLQDTILVRLSSGQIVRVPKSLLKRVANATGQPNFDTNRTQSHSTIVIQSPPISSRLSIQNQSDMKTQTKSNGNSNPSISSTQSSLSFTPVSTPFVSRLSEALEKLSFQKSPLFNKQVNDDNQKTVVNGILKKLADCAGNGKNNVVKTVKIRAYQGTKDSNKNSSHIRRDFGIGKLSLQLKKAEQKLNQISQRTIHVPNLGVNKNSSQMLMMSGGGSVTRVVIPKWLNVTVAPPSRAQSNIVAVSPTKQTQNIIRIRGPLPSRTQTHAQQNTLVNLASNKNIITPGSSLLLKEDIKSPSNVIQKISIGNNSPLKIISTGATRTFVSDINGVLKQQHHNPQQLRVIHQQSPILYNNVVNNATVVNTLFKDTSGSPIVIKKSLVSNNSIVHPNASTLFNISNNKSSIGSTPTKLGPPNNIGTMPVPKNENVVIVENVNSSSKETPNSFLKAPFLSARQTSIQSNKNSVPAVVMVSKVDHNLSLPKSDISPAPTSIISTINPVQGEVEFYDKEL